MLYLYLIESTTNLGYDAYDSAVVVAATAAKAQLIHPNGKGEGVGSDMWGSWSTMVAGVKATRVGEAGPKLKAGEVVCASFNAG